MNKRLILAFLLTFGFSAALGACGEDDPVILNEANNDPTPDPSPTPTPDPTPDPTPTPTPDPTPDPTPAHTPDPTPDPEPENLPMEEIEVMGGEVSGEWCGRVSLLGAVSVPEGETLSVCAGSVIEVSSQIERVSMEVNGTLQINGTESARVVFSSEEGWVGIVVSGTLEASFADFSGAERCIRGQMASDINVSDATFTGCGTSLTLANGGTFDRTTVIGGNTVRIDGGVLRMTDSTIDFQTDGNVPDCTKWSRGGAVLDHVFFTGCHCPLHFNSATEEVVVTNSIFDRASYPIMVANITGTFTDNHFVGGIDNILDIGGNIDIDIANNYYGGEGPDIGSGDLSQFRNADQFRTEPVPNAGPRQ